MTITPVLNTNFDNKKVLQQNSIAEKNNAKDSLNSYTRNKDYSHHRKNHHRKYDEMGNKIIKTEVFLSTLAGVGTALAIIAKKQGFSLNPKKIFSQHPKDWAIFKIVKESDKKAKDLKFHEPEIIGIGAGSVLGGLAGGCIFDDKKHRKSKLKESVNQMLGDIMIPLAFVAFPTRKYKAFEALAQKETKHLKLKGLSEFIQDNKLLNIICPVLVSGVSLGAGIIAGNRTSNLINEKVYGEKVERKIKATDFAPHLDDVCLAVTLMAGPQSVIGSVISRFVPAALSVAGNEVGNTKNSDHKAIV